MNEGLPVKDACLEVGMPRSTYYYVIAREAEALAEFQNMVVANSRERLWMILVYQVNILQKVIEDGLSEKTKPKDRLAIYKALGEMRDKLAQELLVNSHNHEVAGDALRGPVLRLGKSRFSANSKFEGGVKNHLSV